MSDAQDGPPDVAAGQDSTGNEKKMHNNSKKDTPSGVDGSPNVSMKQEQDAQAKPDGQEQEKGPEGGYDGTQIARPPPGTVGYTVKITMHRATNLPMGDAHSFSSDPYVLARLNTDLPTRHKEDPNLRFRTPTIRKNTEPTWNEEWIVANVPSTGFKLKLRVYDEDPADHDDMLGKVHVTIPSLGDNWEGIHNQPYKLAVRDSSKRALMWRAFAVCLRVTKHMQGELYLSVEVLGRTQGHEDQNGRSYTVGQSRWIRHYSPILGRLAHVKDPSEREQNEAAAADGGQRNKSVQQYNFQANQMQFPGPVPPELYHRFVEFKPWVKRMFTTTGFQGVILGKALHHQHARVYNFGRSTLWGHFPQGPCKEMTQAFLDLVHYDTGGRIFTYVLTLDALFRFTETGNEFGVDLLSKHTMHSDVAIYIAFSGEFFIRRLKHKHHPPPPKPADESEQMHPPNDIDSGPPDDDPPKDPSYYELVIDNDSGTYRPHAKLLPVLATYLSQCLPGLHIKTLDCNADAEEQQRMKAEQREHKKTEGEDVIYMQRRSSSVSSSELEELDGREQEARREQQNRQDIATGDGSGREHGASQAMARDAKLQQQARWNKMKRSYGMKRRDEGEEGEEAPEGADRPSAS